VVPLARAAAFAAGLALAASAAGAQGSPYLPLDDVAYAYLDALQARGRLGELSLLERPYTVQAVRRALRMPDACALGERLCGAIEGALAKYAPAAPADSAYVEANAGIYGVAQTSALRELMLADDLSSAGPGFTIRVLLQAGPVSGAFRAIGDRRLRADPEFPGKKDRVLAGRTEEAYVRAAWRYAELSAGRVGRQWGAPVVPGLQLSPYSYSYDHLFGRLGGERFHLSALATVLDDLPMGGDSAAHRYFSAHRLAGRFGRWEAGISESIVYGGSHRGLEPALANPVNMWSLSQYAEDREVNVAYGADAAWRPRWGGWLAAQLLIDDVQVDAVEEPPSYGATVAVEGVPAGPLRAFASYVRVSNLAYRAVNSWERYASYDVGLGAGFSDYDEWRAGLDAAGLAGIPLRAYLALRRQGEGDYRSPFPPLDSLASTKSFLEGVVWSTARVAVSGAARLPAGIEVVADVGVNRSRNADNVAGRERTEFEGRLRVAFEPRWARIGWGIP
jgi:hypothetical protein